MVVEYCITIPTFNNSETIAAVVGDCLKDTTYPIVVVDDGSDTPVATLVPKSERVTVLRLDRNLGKGVAIRTAIAHALNKGFTHLITLDGDGQHRSSDIVRLTNLCDQYPWDLILGARDLSGVTVPKVSRFGRRFSNFWIRYETDSRVIDSQSGFRIYPLFHVQCLNLTRSRYDFEIEVLTKLLWKGVGVREAEIFPIYPEGRKRISHFRGFVDNARISILNTHLVIAKLFRTPSKSLPQSLGWGVFIGCTPFFGFHWLIAAAFSLVFRLHFPTTFIATQISAPPFAPFLAYISLKIGQSISHAAVELPGYSDFSLNAAMAFFELWLLGSCFLGLFLGLTVGMLAYGLKSRLSAQRKLWTGKGRGGVFGNWFMNQVVNRLGLRAAYAFLWVIVPYFYLFAPRARRASHEYLKTIFPTAPRPRIFLTLRHFYYYGKVLLDRIADGHSALPLFSSRSTGTDRISTPALENHPVIVVGAHVGSWELAAKYLDRKGIGGQFYSVEMVNRSIVIQGTRESATDSTWSNPILSIYAQLKEGRPVGMMGDRPLTSHCELVPFLGKLALFDVTPFQIAMITGSSVIMSVGFKGPDSFYEFFATDASPLVRESGRSKELQLKRAAAEFAHFLEGKLKLHPYQWFNFFPFWSQTPFDF